MRSATAGSGGAALAVPGGGTLAGTGDLDLAVARRSVRHELREQPRRRGRDGLDGPREGLLVRLRRLGHPADLAHVLERRVPDVLLGRRGVVVMKWADVSAHGRTLASA